MRQQYDSLFLGILQNEADIGKFLDTIFSFLYRNTDFYVVMHDKQAEMGFAPGVAAKLVNQLFKKYENLAKLQQRRQTTQSAAATAATPTEKDSTMQETNAAAESDVMRSDASESHQGAAPVIPSVSTNDDLIYKSKDTPALSKDTPALAADVKQTDPCAVNRDSPLSEKASPDKSDGNGHPQAPSSSNNNGSDETGKATTEDGNDDVKKREQSVFQAHSESYNGAQRDNYSWSQEIKDVDIQVKIPSYVVKGGDVRVSIQRKHIAVSYRSAKDVWCCLLDDDLTWDINVEESMWTLVPQEHIHVNLEKVQERWWDALIIGEDTINVRNIDASRPMSDLDGEAQAKIDEMVYNQRQKQLGLPQSTEKKMQDMLRKAWDAEGSPFKGQPFDTSKLNMSSDNTMNIDS